MYACRHNARQAQDLGVFCCVWHNFDACPRVPLCCNAAVALLLALHVCNTLHSHDEHDAHRSTPYSDKPIVRTRGCVSMRLASAADGNSATSCLKSPAARST